MAGAMAKIMPVWAIMRWAAGPSSRSRMMARDTTMPAPADMPCSTRPSQSTWIVPAKTQTSDAATYTAKATSNTRLRPSASASAPCQSIMKAKAAM